jgi:hypothetical protein
LTDLDDPPALEDVEPSGLGVSGDDLGIDAEGGGVFDEPVLEAPVDPDLGYRRVECLGLVQDPYSGVVLVDGCGADDDGGQQAERVDGDPAFAADDQLPFIPGPG